ncbi:MAG: ABC-F family ATP-binding cassette domain-containing protein [Trueperaceae bacterium]|nr:ABC-F family ATP-binding cassette domain-containing protein [Trueperaceae bacterium]
MATVTLLEATDLRIRRGEREILRGASLVVRRGERIALVGANGSGKSTLLALLAGVRTPDEGTVRRAPGIRLASVGQHVEAAAGVSLITLAGAALGPLRELERQLERAAANVELHRKAAIADGPDSADPSAPSTVDAPDAARRAGTERYLELLDLYEEGGGFTAGDRLRTSLTRFGLPEEMWDRPAADLSGGERRRACIAGALASGADLVLLDEPTNHLDLGARAALRAALVAHPGAIVVASHDRALLDAVATHVARLEGGRLERRRGGYADVQRDRATAERTAERALRARSKRIEALECMAAELARHGHRAAQTRRRRAERERSELTIGVRGTGRARDPLGALATSTGGARGEIVAATHLRADGVLDDASLRIERGARIAIVGPSGSGKTTLLDLLTGERASDDPRAELRFAASARVVVLDQVWRGLDADRSPLDTLQAWVGERRAESLLTLVGLPHDAWARPASTLSGGERGRTGLALLVAREADLIVLDEPTNDLDLVSIESLEATLLAAEAAIVVATHDERLIAALDAEVWAVESGAIVRYRGGLEGYRRGARRLEHDVVVALEPWAPTSGEGPADAAVTIEEIEAELAVAEEALLDPTKTTARDLVRWRSRREELEARRLELWEANATPPEPRFRTREGGLRIWADRDGAALRVWIDGGPTLLVRPVGAVGHVIAERSPDASVLPWAWRLLCHGAARLACYLLSVDAVQVATDVDLGTVGAHASPFVPLAPGWWVAHRDDLEAREGWRSRPSSDAVARVREPSAGIVGRDRRRRRWRRRPRTR